MIETRLTSVNRVQNQPQRERGGRADGARGETCFDTREIPSEFLGRRKRPNKHLYSEISAPFVS